MRHEKFLTALTVTISLLCFNSNASTFDLFNPDRGKLPQTTPPSKPTPLSNPFRARGTTKPPRQTPKTQKPLPQKDFTLQGTSRIGKKRAVVLKGPDNKEFIQYFKDKKKTRTPEGHIGVAIKGYSDYYLLSVEAREVRIEYPGNSPCRKSNEQKGLKCDQADDGRTATLGLMRRKALKAPKPPKPTKTAAQKAKKREDARKKRQETYKNFKRRVIKDEDVPPGMRVVRTPFGDRLVPIK